MSTIVQDLGKEWESVKCYHKPFTGCRLTHSGRQGVLVLKQEHNIKLDDIDKVIWRVAEGNLMVTAHCPDVGEPLSAHSSSGPFLVANVLAYDDVGTGCFSDARLNDPKVHELARKVEMVADPELTKASEQGFQAARGSSIEIHTTDGKTFCYSTRYVKGDPVNGWRMTDDELKEKFRTYCANVLSQGKIEAALDMIWRLEEVEAGELMDLLSVRG